MTLLSVTRGDSPTFLITLVDIDEDTPLDLTDLSLTFTAKLRYSDPDDDAVIQKTIDEGIEIVSAEGGTANLRLEPEDTADIDVPKTLVWDLQVTNALGDDVRTPLGGRLVIRPDVTRTVGEAS